jgi:serine/threonine protein kinase
LSDDTAIEVDLTAPSIRLNDLESFGNYRIVGQLAKGGMAELSLAVQTGMEGFSRVVALKRVLPSNAESAPFVQMFLDEARLAARLDHPQIVRIYELGVEQGRYFMAMEFLPGEDVQRIVELSVQANAPVAPDIAAVIVERAAEALHFAHELTDNRGSPLNLVHRDVNPSNLLLTYNGHVKVVDFGIAKAASNNFQTGEGVMKGKIAYLAPEQFTPHMQIDRRCDVFGLGIILWELLAAQKLFQRDTTAATLWAVHQGAVPALSALRPDVDEELEAIAVRALERDPAKRYQSAGEMHDALEEYLRTRSARPTERELGRWLEQLGGPRRAELKRGIARGANVISSYSELCALGLSDRPGNVGPATPLAAEVNQPLWQVALFALIAACVVGIAGWYASRDPIAKTPEVEAAARASAQIESDPPGAFVFIDGEPTGKVTPATLGSLDPARPVQLRLEKLGYTTLSTALTLEPGKQVSQRFQLVAQQGLVTFTHVPEGGTVRVAGQLARAGEELALRVGKAQVEVLVGGRVARSRVVEVVAGPQSVDLSP